MAEKYVALSKVKRKINYVLSVYGNGLVNRKIAEALKNVPVEDVVPVVHGHWIIANSPTGLVDIDRLVCSECGYKNYYFCKFKFCPICGAKMDGERNI